MSRFLFRKEFGRLLFYLLLILLGLWIATNTAARWDLRDADAQDDFLERYGTSDVGAFETFLKQAVAETTDRVEEINTMQDPDGVVEEDSLIGILSGTGGGYTSLALEELRSQMLLSPGKYAATVEADERMTSKLYARMQGQFRFDAQKANSIELMQRAIRRAGGAESPQAQVYVRCLLTYEQLRSPDKLVNPVRIQFFLQRLQSDSIFFLLFYLLNFAVFASLRQSGISSVIRVSGRGVRWFTRRRVWVAFFINTIVFIMYTGIQMLQTGENFLTGDVLQQPVQILDGLGTLPWNITVRGYIGFVLLARYGVCMAFSMAVLLGSLLSRSIPVAALICAVPTVLLYLVFIRTLPVPDTVCGLLTGDILRFFNNNPYVQLGNTLLFSPPLYPIALGGVVLLLAAVITQISARVTQI